MEEHVSSLTAASKADVQAAQKAAADELAKVKQMHQKAWDDELAANKAASARTQAERDSAIKELQTRHANELQQVHRELEQRLADMEAAGAKRLAEAQSAGAKAQLERDQAKQERDEAERRLTEELEAKLAAAEEASAVAAAEAQAAADAAAQAHAAALQAAREEMMSEQVAAIADTESRIRQEERTLRENALAEAAAVHAAEVESIQGEANAKITEVQQQADSTREASSEEIAVAQARFWHLSHSVCLGGMPCSKQHQTSQEAGLCRKLLLTRPLKPRASRSSWINCVQRLHWPGRSWRQRSRQLKTR
jgi:hypothetical protein